MVSLADVARRAGVAAITVSRVMRNEQSVAELTRDRVLRAVDELGYIPNALARSLKGSGSGIIALIITDITSTFFNAVARGATEAARELGWSLLLGNSEEQEEIEAEYLRKMGEHRIEGLILVPTLAAAAPLRRYLPRDTPVVLLDRGLPDIAADSVLCDTGTGVRELALGLIRRGAHRIALVGGMPNVATWPMRIAGFRAALAQDDTGCTGAIIDGDYQRDSGKSAAAHLLRQDDRPNAIIAANAQVALGVLEAAGELGLRVPEGLMVAAIDDPFPASPFSPFLAIVQQPGYDMGAAAVRLLARRSDPARRFSPYEKLVFPASVRL